MFVPPNRNIFADRSGNRVKKSECSSKCLKYTVFLFYFCPLLYRACKCNTARKISKYNLFWSVFSRIWTEYGDFRSKSPYSLQIRENTDQRNSVFGQCIRSGKFKLCRVITSNNGFHKI